MPKKKRGRPPGSKNKTKSTPGAFAKMGVEDLRAYIGRLESMLTKKVQEQRSFLEGKLSELAGLAPSKSANGRAAKKVGTRRKAAPKYQSKKNRGLKWSGRGMTPIWMRDEMKGTKLKKDDFLINSA